MGKRAELHRLMVTTALGVSAATLAYAALRDDLSAPVVGQVAGVQVCNVAIFAVLAVLAN